MFLRSLVLPFVLSTATAHAYDFPIEVIEYIDQTRVVAFIKEEDIDKTLQWAPFQGPPPLTLADALEAVQEYMVANPELRDAVPTEIELKRIPQHEKHWHYLVRMQSGGGGKPRAWFLIVLMDGNIIAGLREPEGIK
ncbi:MAG: hypothetical protein PVI91_15090 [Gammaproteobacteria bacterium]|jgi:hypothetical protein